jgi:hypothetical protein
MNKVLINGLIFVSGCALGFAAGIKITKARMLAEQEERETEMRRIYAAKIMKVNKEQEDAPVESKAAPVPAMTVEANNLKKIATEARINNPDLKETAKKLLEKEANKIISREGYSSDPDRGPLDEDDEDEDDEDDEPEPILEKISRGEDLKPPYIITPSEFGEEDYEEIELTYWADNVLSEDRDIIEDPDDVVGTEALHSFGQYEDGDVVYVRDDRKRIDYAILRDYRNYYSLPKNQRR